MVEKRRAKRLKDDDEIVVTVFADGKKFPKGKFTKNQSKDISLLGVRIKVNIYLPPGSFIRAEMKLKSKYPPITIIGQVKWIKAIKAEKNFEAGVEFYIPLSETMEYLKEYMSSLNITQPENISK